MQSIHAIEELHSQGAIVISKIQSLPRVCVGPMFNPNKESQIASEKACRADKLRQDRL